MELPNIGKQCGLSTCNQLDFLPFVCDLCKSVYCKDHMGPSQHQCAELKDNVLTEKPTSTSIVSFKCSENDCKALDQVEMLCQKCARHFCVCHRFHECHQIETSRRKQLREQWKIPKEQFKQAKLVTDKQIEEKLNKAEIQTEKRGLALKVRLMKLKSKAQGDHRIPTLDRIYVNVHGPKQDNVFCRPLYVSKDWSIGKVIDFVAGKMKIVNDNKSIATKDKLRLYKTNGELIAKDFGKLLNDIIQAGIVYNGENIILERSSLDVLDNVEYDFVV